MNRKMKKNTESQWVVVYVPPGRVNYDALLDAKTFDGCKQYSSYAGLGLPTELTYSPLFCDCSACTAGSMDPSKGYSGCINADWLASPQVKILEPRTAADCAMTRLETELAMDEYTAQIPGSCHIAIYCDLDDAGYRFWVARTVGRLRVVAEGCAFESAGIRYDEGDKYFIVHYYEHDKKNEKQALSVDNVIPNQYVRNQAKGYVNNHLLIKHYGFDMPL